MYISSILMLLSWPLIILITWYVVRYALDRYEKKQIKLKNEGEQKE